MANIIFPNDFNKIEDLSNEDVLLINDASKTDETQTNNFYTTIEQLTNFIKSNESGFMGIATADANLPNATHTKEYYFATKKGKYYYNNPVQNVYIDNDNLNLLYTIDAGKTWQSSPLVETSTFATTETLNNEIAKLQPDNYVQKDVTQDEPISTLDFATIQSTDGELWFRMYNERTQEAEKLNQTLLKNALQSYITDKLKDYPTFSEVYAIFRNLTGIEDAIRELNILKGETSQLVVPFPAAEKVEINHKFNHVPKVLILDEKGNTVDATITYSLNLRTITCVFATTVKGTAYLN